MKHKTDIKNTLYVLDLQKSAGNRIIFTKKQTVIKNANRNRFLTFKKKTQKSCVKQPLEMLKLLLWHQRFGDYNFKNLQELKIENKTELSPCKICCESRAKSFQRKLEKK